MSRSQQFILASFAVIVPCVHPAVLSPAAAQDSDSIFFHDDYSKALEEARLTKKPMFLEFRCAP